MTTREWAEDFHGVWHRQSSTTWEAGVGPADPAACCGRKILSVHHSTFHPSELDDGTDPVCGVPTRAMSFWQPWATLVAEGIKSIETRPKQHPWRSAIGHTIAIHAAKRAPEHALIGDWEVGRLDPGLPRRLWSTVRHDAPLDLPLGAVVATARIANVVPMTDPFAECIDADGRWIPHVTCGDVLRYWPSDLTPEPTPPVDIEKQRPYGDFAPGRWAILLDTVRKVAPFPCRGYQGLWRLPPGVADSLLGWAA